MRYENNAQLQHWLEKGGARHLRGFVSFEFDDHAFEAALEEVLEQHPQQSYEQAQARAAYRLLTHNATPAGQAPVAIPSWWRRAFGCVARAGAVAWPALKILWAIALLAALMVIAAAVARAEPNDRPLHRDKLPPAFLHVLLVTDQPGGVIIQLQNQGAVLATRPAGLVVFNCGSNMSCSFSGSTFTLGASGSLGSAFNNITSGTNTGATMTVGTGATLNFTGSGVVNATQIQGVSVSGTPNVGQIPIASSGSAAAWGDPVVSGPDAPGTAPTKNPVQLGAFDGTNVQRVASDTSGDLKIVFPSAQSVNAAQSGSWTVQQGSPPWSVSESGTWTVQPGNTANTTPWLATINQGGNSVAVSAANALKVDGSAVTQPVSGTITANQGTPANWATNVAQFGGTNVVTGTGASGSGIPRVTLSNDSSLAANQSVNEAQIGGSNVVADPCMQLARSSVNINLTASGQLITGAASKQTYICSMNLITATAQNIALVEGTGTTCGTGTAGMAGGTTAATGWNLAANGGFVNGDGRAWVFKTATAADNVCLLLSSTGQTSGSVSYVQQ